MTPIQDTNTHFFQHKSEEGYIIALRRRIGGSYSVDILDGENELLTVEARNHHDVQFIYETLFQWLAFCPGDIPQKCIKLKKANDIAIAFQLLPLKDVHIAFPDLKQLEYEEFKKTVKR